MKNIGAAPRAAPAAAPTGFDFTTSPPETRPPMNQTSLTTLALSTPRLRGINRATRRTGEAAWKSRGGQRRRASLEARSQPTEPLDAQLALERLSAAERQVDEVLARVSASLAEFDAKRTKRADALDLVEDEDGDLD